MSVAAFVILITLNVSGHQHDPFLKTCADQACVEEVISHAHESPYLRRLQVFNAGEYARSNVSGATLWPPLLDLTFD